MEREREDPLDELDDVGDPGAEAEAAAAEAAAIGGPTPDYGVEDPADHAVAEGGGGEAEGFEQAEASLTDHAEHGEGGIAATGEGLAGEVESDRSGAAYGEADHVETSEVVSDPDNP